MPLVATWLTRRLGLRVPVVAAPMAGVSGGELAAAVSAAGGLGMVGIGPQAEPGWVRAQARTAAASGAPWGAGLLAWSLPARPELLDALLDDSEVPRPALVSVSYGDLTPYVATLQDAGILVATQVGTVADARAAEDAGVDLIVARGGEGGGHGRNLVATLPLLQGVLGAVSTPVVAAGGVGSSRALAAVLAAGAVGGWVGTALLCCAEALTADDVAALLGAVDETGTAYGTVFDAASAVGWPAEFGGRAVRNAFFDAWSGREDELGGDEGALALFGAAASARDLDALAVYAGQGVGLLDGRRRPAADVIAELAGAADLLRAAGRLVQD